MVGEGGGDGGSGSCFALWRTIWNLWLCVFSQFLSGVAAQDEKAFLFSFLLPVCSRIPRWMGGRGTEGWGVEGGEGVRVRFAT